MTCIVGMEKPGGGVIIGGDAMISTPWNGSNLKYPKVFKTGEFVYGYCGNLRAGQVLQYAFPAPQLPDENDDEAMEKYLVSEWVEALRSALLTGGVARIKNEVYRTDDAAFLFGVRGRLYSLEDDFAVWRSTRGYHAMGSGEEFALGAFEALKGRRLSPRRQVEIALQAASEHANTVGGPITIVEVD